MSIVIDASIAVKWFVEEINSDRARDILSSGHTLVAPSHSLGEIGEALTRGFRRGTVSRDQLDDVIEDILYTLDLLSPRLAFTGALNVAIETKLSFYDSLYVSLAEMLNLQLVTADEAMLRKLAASRWSSRVIALQDWTKPPGPLH